MKRIMLILPALVCAGCVRPKNVGELKPSISPYMEALRQARARGHLDFATGGSPLSAGAKQVFFLGPENLTISFSGEVDFTQEPAHDRTAGAAEPGDRP